MSELDDSNFFGYGSVDKSRIAAAYQCNGIKVPIKVQYKIATYHTPCIWYLKEWLLAAVKAECISQTSNNLQNRRFEFKSNTIDRK